MGANKKKQMQSFADDWPDQIWEAVRSMNNGKGAAWALALAAMSITGCRPASLEKGIVFSIVRIEGINYLEATIPGVKLTATRGQGHYKIRWGANSTHRPDELLMVLKNVLAAPDRKISLSYDAEAISTRLREISSKLWPRRKYKITAYCYRELMSKMAKSSGAKPEEIAIAMGHRSTESQGRYAAACRRVKGGKKPWDSVQGDKAVRSHRSPMARFKEYSSIKRSAMNASVAKIYNKKTRISI